MASKQGGKIQRASEAVRAVPKPSGQYSGNTHVKSVKGSSVRGRFAD